MLTPFSRTLRPLLLLTLAAVLSGCFQTKALIRLNADGSGTVQETVLMNSMMAMTMSAGGGAGLFGESFEDPDAPQMAADGPYSLELLQARAEEMGTTFQGVEPIEITFGAGYTATYAFADINDLRLSGNAMGDIGSMMGEAGASGDDDPITFTFSRGALTVRMPEPDFGNEMTGMEEDIEFDYEEDPKKDPSYDGDFSIEDASDDSEMEEMAMFLKDMKFSIALELPSDITQTNASYASGRTLTLFDMDFGLLAETPGVMEQLEALGMNGPPSASMGAMQIFQSIPGFTYEPEREITVSF